MGKMTETVNHPDHYNNSDYSFECIDLARNYTFDVGNAIKYVFRRAHKGDWKENLQKARWYLDDAIQAGEDFMPLVRNEICEDHLNELAHRDKDAFVFWDSLKRADGEMARTWLDDVIASVIVEHSEIV